MAGGLIIALPLYWFRLHNTEITDDDFEGPPTREDRDGSTASASASAVRDVVTTKNEGSATVVSEKGTGSINKSS